MPTKYQAIIIVSVPTTRVVIVGLWFAEDGLELGNSDRVDVGELISGSGVCTRRREFLAVDWTGVILCIVGNGEIVEEVVFGVCTIAPVGFDQVARIVLPYLFRGIEASELYGNIEITQNLLKTRVFPA